MEVYLVSSMKFWKIYPGLFSRMGKRERKIYNVILSSFILANYVYIYLRLRRQDILHDGRI